MTDKFIVGDAAGILKTGNMGGFIRDGCDTGPDRFRNGHDCLKDARACREERETVK